MSAELSGSVQAYAVKQDPISKQTTNPGESYLCYREVMAGGFSSFDNYHIKNISRAK